ncbi:MAG TPA: hypothetical protein VI685_03595 [Candidatus Angelobacter sp.]
MRATVDCRFRKEIETVGTLHLRGRNIHAVAVETAALEELNFYPTLALAAPCGDESLMKHGFIAPLLANNWLVTASEYPRISMLERQIFCGVLKTENQSTATIPSGGWLQWNH